MPRIARVVVPDIPYHITQRGNHRQDVFLTPDDRQRYLELLGQYSSACGLDVLGYCLMTNHVHIIGIPRRLYSMSRTIRTVQMRHTQVVNREMKWSGHLWHSRYFSCALDEVYLFKAMRYVEQNPVRAGLVRRAEDYPWSSAAFHCGVSQKADFLFTSDELERMFEDWSAVLAEVPDKESMEIIRRRTMTGIPCGDERFIRKISKNVGYKIVERTRGGQKKQVK